MIERRTTASGEVRYDVRLRGPDGNERSRTFRARRDARAFEASELAKRNRKAAPRTVRRDFGVLRAVLNHAVERDLLARSPCRGIKLPKAERIERPVLDAEDLGRLAHEVGPSGPMAYLAAVLGLRWGEIAGLRVGRIGFAVGTITVAEQVVRDERGASVVGPPKSDAGRRTLAAPAWLLDILREHLGERVHQPDAFVFTDSVGGHLAYSSWRTRVWDPAAVRAGLATPEEQDGKSRYQGVTFHDLRRANATALVGTGVDVKTAQRRLGHSDVRLTLDVYAQAVDDLDRLAAERVGSHFRPAESERAGSETFLEGDAVGGERTESRREGDLAGDRPSARGMLTGWSSPDANQRGPENPR